MTHRQKVKHFIAEMKGLFRGGHALGREAASGRSNWIYRPRWLRIRHSLDIILPDANG
jgi:hypothetical protein